MIVNELHFRNAMQQCNKCQSKQCILDKEIGFWKCLNCDRVWSYLPKRSIYKKCEECYGLGLSLNSIFVRECKHCSGTGIYPEPKP